MNVLSRHLLCASLVLAASLAGAEPAAQYPKLKDDRLEVTLYASDPDIVTPIGCCGRYAGATVCD